MYKLIKDQTAVIRISDGAYLPENINNIDWKKYILWLAAGNTPEPAEVDPIPTQFELDQRRYQKRAAVQTDLMAWMAADNMSRVRAGMWTVQDLTNLLADPAVQAAQTYMSTLSYELAAQAIASATTPLLTPEIRSVWIQKLTQHFYLVP